jgi:TolA-binding protein
MITRITVLATLAATLTGCAMTQKGAVSRAEKAYGKNEYQTCLKHLSRAESYGKHSEVVSAQVLFNRGLCLEGLGRKPEAVAVYKTLIESYPNSSLSVQAKARIES